MISGVMTDATRLITAVSEGDSGAAAKLLPIVYDELRRLARAQMSRERASHTLEATALVHEAYLRLIDAQPDGWDGRRHFFAAAAEAMRRILIEHARRKQSIKCGGKFDRMELDDDLLPAIASPCDSVDDLLALNDALERLKAEDRGKAELIQLLYFAGLTLEEAAQTLGLSKTTAHRQWTFARAWLFEAMGRTTV